MDRAGYAGQRVVIAGAVRTAIGRFGGALADVPAADLGAAVIRAAVERSAITPDRVDEVILGCVLQAGQGQNMARQAAVKAGLPDTVPAMTVNHVCGSGLKAVTLAAQAIACGDADVVIAGGTESMSLAPYLVPKARRGYRMGHGVLVDAMIQDGLRCAFGDEHMGESVERTARRYGIDRAAQDAYALLSQQRAAAAWEVQRFAAEIVPVGVPGKNGATPFDRDEHPRPDTSAAKLAGLKPAFRADGSVTAGNASGIADGAAALLLASPGAADRLGLSVVGRFVAGATVALAPENWPLGPVAATRRALDRAGWRRSDLDLIECNEAFAAQVLAVIQELAFDPAIVNVNGGAIALGHPIGASGARILVTLLHAMARRDARRGLATLCIGGGQGMAVLVER
jgi:acetyl-CoA C-acetyltransferase